MVQKISSNIENYLTHKEFDFTISSVVKPYFWIHLFLVFFILFVFIISLPLIKKYLFDNNFILCIAFILAVIIQNLIAFFNGLLQGLKEFKLLFHTRYVYPVVLFCILILLYIFKLFSLKTISISFVISLTLNLLFCIALIKKFFPFLRGFVSIPKTYGLNPVIKQSLNISISGLSTFVLISIGPIIVKIASQVDDTNRLVAFLMVTLAICRILDNLFKTFIRSAYPYFSSWFAGRKILLIKKYLMLLLVTVATFYGLCIVVTCLWGKILILSIYGNKYVDSYKFLIVGFGAFLFVSLADVLLITLYSAEKENYTAKASIFAFMVYLIIFTVGLITSMNPIITFYISLGCSQFVLALLFTLKLCKVMKT